MIQQAKFVGLYTPFANLMQEFDARLKAAGLDFWLTFGFRSIAEQDKLYAQGRTTSGQVITNARGGDSWHNYGLAADWTCDRFPDKPGLQPTWELSNPNVREAYNEFGKVAMSMGLEWGGSWKHFPDYPHVEMRYGLELRDARNLYAAGGIDAVWGKCGQ